MCRFTEYIRFVVLLWLMAVCLAVSAAGGGGGRLLFTSMNLIEKMDSCPEARQMAVSLLRYMNSADFAPAAEMTVGELHSFISATDNSIKIGAESIY